MRIEVYKTYEIPNEYWVHIITGFNASFEGHETTSYGLKKAFESNHFGYSYHAICSKGGVIIGFNTIIPNYYLKANKQQIKVGLSGSTYVLKEYRKEIFIFRDMYLSLMEYCKDENLIVFLGVPNMNSYKYTLKILKKKEILSLSYYVFPKNLFSIVGKGRYSYLNFLSKAFTFTNLLMAYIFSSFINTNEKKRKYRIVQDEKYLSKRFQNKRYKTKIAGNIRFTYVLYNEGGIKTAYLIYFTENGQKSFRALVKAIHHIYSHEKFDLIMYVGTINLSQFLLLKAPRRFEPKRLPLTYSILDINNKEDFEDMGIRGNWDFSLMNFDVR